MLRFELVDYLHLVYKCIAAPPLSCVMYIDGERKVVDTAIPNFTSKDIWRFSSNGKHSTGVFLEGGAPIRKAYFNAVANFREWVDTGELPKTATPSKEEGYKAGRVGLNPAQKQGINLTIDRLMRGGVSLYQLAGFEADDLLWTAYKQLRTQYPDAHIDIYTGDMDMLPMVDEHTSVYMRGNRTWAEPMCGMGYCDSCRDGCEKYSDDTCKCRREYKNYFEVTPVNWDEFISYRSAFKGYKIPYNSVYLFKMLRGDTSDNVPMVAKGYGPKKWNEIIDKMTADGVQFDKIFRYDTPWSVIQPILLNYFDNKTVAFMMLNAEGIRPRSCMGDLINLIPYPNGTGAKIDVTDVYNKLKAGETIVPGSDEERRRSMIVYDCMRKGINPALNIQLTPPVVPDIGKLQPSLSELKINLSTKSVAY